MSKPGEKLSPQEAVAKYQAEMLEERGTEFLPFTFHMPVAVVVGKVSSDFRLIDLVALDEPEFRPHVLARDFWRGWEGYRRPTLVTFNGRTFDLPVLELAALRYGLSVGGWFDVSSKSFEQARNRFNVTSHIDLQELLTNFGATRFPGGLTLAANLLGKPGKMETEGSMVQSMYDQGRLAASTKNRGSLPKPRSGCLVRRRIPRDCSFIWIAGATGRIPGSRRREMPRGRFGRRHG
jgi:predicted PolB exonuclease-like 3'-5' exonuclease